MTSEYATQIILTKQMVDQLQDETRKQHIQRLLAGAMVKKLVYDGTRVLALEEYIEDAGDPLMRGAVEINDIVSAEDDPALDAALARMLVREDALLRCMVNLNTLPWWRLLWLKLRRQPLIAWPEAA
jgi:hypothetical protein